MSFFDQNKQSSELFGKSLFGDKKSNSPTSIFGKSGQDHSGGIFGSSAQNTQGTALTHTATPGPVDESFGKAAQDSNSPGIFTRDAQKSMVGSSPVEIRQDAFSGSGNPFDENIIKDVPISIRQKSFGELLSFLKKQLEENVREFRKKALETFSYDEKIIKARNNYAKILHMVKVETQKLNELDENVDFFLQYIKDMDKATEGENVVNVIREVEKLSDELNTVIKQIKDDDDDVIQLVNENMSLIRAIDERLNEID